MDDNARIGKRSKIGRDDGNDVAGEGETVMLHYFCDYNCKEAPDEKAEVPIEVKEKMQRLLVYKSKFDIKRGCRIRCGRVQFAARR